MISLSVWEHEAAQTVRALDYIENDFGELRNANAIHLIKFTINYRFSLKIMDIQFSLHYGGLIKQDKMNLELRIFVMVTPQLYR